MKRQQESHQVGPRWWAGPAPVALALLVIAVLSGCGGSSATPPPATAIASPVQADIGSQAPPFSLRTTAGTQIALADYRGRPVIVEFLATW